MPRIAIILLLSAIVLASATAAQCYKPGTRVVIFVQGVYTELDAQGTQETGVEAHRFDTLKQAFRDRGYGDARLLDFSYAGGSIGASGAWKPLHYSCEQTDRVAATNVATLEAMVRDLHARDRDAHFTIVGHSLGGHIAMLAGARDAARAPDQRLGIDVVVTLDAPLLGVSPDKKAIFDFVPCEKTYEAGAELVAARLDPATPDIRRYQAGVMAAEGVRLGTFGNVSDCLWNTARCIGGDWVDDSDTQFLDGQAAVSMRYDIVADPLYSHDAILADAVAVADVVAFVGAP